MKLLKPLFLCLMLALSVTPSFAVEPDEVLEDPALEARAREISKYLRCLVCQNENIDSSHAPLARDLRLLVRERLVAGDTDEEVVKFLVDRYGDFVLLKPPVQSNTFVLWFAPALFMILGGAGVFFYLRRTPSAAAEAGLSEEEQAELRKLIGDGKSE